VKIQATQTAFAAILADGAVVTWGYDSPLDEMWRWK
jgi:hypothetical protein